MLYAETGRFPISIMTKSRMFNFWLKLNNSNHNKLSYKIYQCLLNVPNFESKWIKGIKQILIEIGRYDLWINQRNLLPNFKLDVKQKLSDIYLQQWHASLQNSSKGRQYSFLKQEHRLEKYLIDLKPTDALYLLKLRTSNHYFPIETGRWNDIDLQDRSCRYCFLPGEIADDYHYILKCPYFNQQRQAHINRYYTSRPNMIKFKQLMTTSSNKTLTNLSKFARIIIQTVKLI